MATQEVFEVGHVGHSTFIIEYDLPSDSRRKRFYRAVRRYLEAHELNGSGWSTASVVVTKNERFAWFVHNKALGTGGTSHIYEGRQLDDEPRARARNGIQQIEEVEK